MRIFYLLVILSLTSCFSLQRGFKLASFSYNGKNHDSLISNRSPDYGISGKDGCIVEHQICLSLDSMSNNELLGVIRDAQTLEPIIAGIVEVGFRDSEIKLSILTDTSGTFKFARTSDIVKIEIRCVGCRTLVIANDKPNTLN